ncbi:MAG: malectin domain-containing carbohydrate-binding protein, partial [Armatimonadota bacterium]
MHRHIIKLTVALAVAAFTCGATHAQSLGPVRGELAGGSTVYTVDEPVFETTDDATYQTERYGQEFAYVFHGLPSGPARLKLGFAENNWQRAGERIFDVRVNGETVLDDFDILEHVGPDEAFVRVVDISVPDGAPLRIEFEAEKDNAKVNLLRIYTSEWVFETTPKDERTSSLQPRQRDLPASEDVWETQLGKLGSRVAINPRPQQGVWWQSPLGHAEYRSAYFDPPEVDFRQQAARYVFGVRVGDVTHSLPFDDRLEHFSKIDQTETMSELSYQCASPELPVDARFTWGAPFYPGDVELSTAPYLTLQVDVTNNSHRAQSGEVLIGRSLPIGEPMRAFSEDGLTGLRRAAEVFELPTEERWVIDDTSGFEMHTSGMPLSVGASDETIPTRTDTDGRIVIPIVWEQPFGGLTWEFSLNPGETKNCRIVYVGWADGPVQNVSGADQRFKYHDFFDSPHDVARYAFDNWDAIRERCAFVESVVEDATLPESLKQLLAFATHSYLVNTWWTTTPAGEDFFTVWEGCCQLQSTVDVEYNIAPFYFSLWPELLRMELDQWPGHIEDGVLAHDMGVGLEVNGMAYWHPMEIEENTNYVLLLHHYWRHSGDREIVERNFAAVQELLQWVTDADTDHDGLPEEGLYNTIDQGSPAIQYAPDQVYLAVRQIAAYQAGAQMAREVGEAAVADAWLQRANLTATTLANEAWLDDHFVVALNQEEQATSGRGRSDSYGGAGMEMEDDGADYIGWEDQQHYEGSSEASTMRGWDSYSIYTTNGLVYPMRSGMMVDGLEIERLREDLRNA